MASSLVARSVGLAQLTDDFVRGPTCSRCSRASPSPRRLRRWTARRFAPSETVAIVTRGGTVHASEPIVFAKGSRQHPLSREELYAKFVDCLGDDLSAPAGTARSRS